MIQHGQSFRAILIVVAALLVTTNRGEGQSSQKKDREDDKRERTENKKSPKEVLGAAAKVIMSNGKCGKDVVDADYQHLLKLFDDQGGVDFKVAGEKDPDITKALMDNKGLHSESLEATAAAWTGLRLGGRDIPHDEPIKAGIFANALRELVRVTISSKPDEAQVYFWDEKNLQGNTELTMWVLPGKLRIILTKDGYQKSDETIDIGKKSRTYSKTLINK